MPRPSPHLPNADDFVKYCFEGLDVNLFALMIGLHGGMQVRAIGNGAAALRFCKFDGKGHNEYRVPATLVLTPAGAEWSLFSKDEAIQVMCAVVRQAGPAAYSFIWTQRGKSVFREALLWSGPLMGHVPFQLAQVFRVGRSDLWMAGSAMVLELVARVPNASRLQALCEHAFESGGWELDLATANALLPKRVEWAIQCVTCTSDVARLYLESKPLYVSLRDWALLACFLLTSGRELAAAIPQLRRPLAISEIK